MIITFCGHSNFQATPTLRQRLLKWLEQNAGEYAVFYLGGYGRFDTFALDCVREYKQEHKKVKIIFVTPYLSLSYQKNRLDYEKKRYDEILYPNIECVPQKFAIIKRNRFMVENADWIVAFVNHDWGGAYSTYEYAKKKNKNIFNLANDGV